MVVTKLAKTLDYTYIMYKKKLRGRKPRNFSFLVNQFVVLRSEARKQDAVAVSLINGNLKNLKIRFIVSHLCTVFFGYTLDFRGGWSDHRLCVKERTTIVVCTLLPCRDGTVDVLHPVGSIELHFGLGYG